MPIPKLKAQFEYSPAQMAKHDGLLEETKRRNRLMSAAHEQVVADYVTHLRELNHPATNLVAGAFARGQDENMHELLLDHSNELHPHTDGTTIAEFSHGDHLDNRVKIRPWFNKDAGHAVLLTRIDPMLGQNDTARIPALPVYSKRELDLYTKGLPDGPKRFLHMQLREHLPDESPKDINAPQEAPDDRPNETIPEDFYALMRKRAKKVKLSATYSLADEDTYPIARGKPSQSADRAPIWTNLMGNRPYTRAERKLASRIADHHIDRFVQRHGYNDQDSARKHLIAMVMRAQQEFKKTGDRKFVYKHPTSGKTTTFVKPTMQQYQPGLQPPTKPTKSAAQQPSAEEKRKAYAYEFAGRPEFLDKFHARYGVSFGTDATKAREDSRNRLAGHFERALANRAGGRGNEHIGHEERNVMNTGETSFGKDAVRVKVVPKKLARQPARENDTGAAMAAEGSQNHKKRLEVVRAVLKEAGLTPATVRAALAHDGKSSRPSFASVIKRAAHPDHLKYTAAWLGLMSGEKRLAVAQPDPDGDDLLHVISAPGSPDNLASQLRNAGVERFTSEKTSNGSRAFVLNPRGKYPVEKVAGSIPNARHSSTRVRVYRLGTGSSSSPTAGTDADARANYRNVIDTFERAAGATGGEA